MVVAHPKIREKFAAWVRNGGEDFCAISIPQRWKHDVIVAQARLEFVAGHDGRAVTVGDIKGFPRLGDDRVRQVSRDQKFQHKRAPFGISLSGTARTMASSAS